MIEVKVLKQAGETGLRLPGTCFFLDEGIANNLEMRGLIKIIKEPVKKEEKAKLETKEEKFIKKPKVTKRKPVTKRK